MMASAPELVQRTLSSIDHVELPHSAAPLLAAFVTEALNPALAARYVSERMSAGETLSLLSDWVHIIDSLANGSLPPAPDSFTRRAITDRDGGKCCVTGLHGSYYDPLLVLPLLPVPTGWVCDRPHVADMINAFFGPGYSNWWLTYAKTPEKMPTLRNHWSIRKSAAKAFAQGLVKLERLQPSMVEYEVRHVFVGPEEPIKVRGSYPLLGDHSRQGIEKVDPRFVGTHARFCRSIRFLQIARTIAPEIFPAGPSLPRSSQFQARRRMGLGKVFPHARWLSRALLTAWLFVPNRMRIAAYDMLRGLGEVLYGKIDDGVQRLPFGLYLKYRGEPENFHNEFNALAIVCRHTSIPAPEPLDFVVKGSTDDPFGSDAYLLITRLPGIPLYRCQDVLPDRDCHEIATQMRDLLTQLRNVPKPANLSKAICNTLGGACRDHRIRGGQPVGPFEDEAAFSQLLRFSDEPSRRGHRISLTHADLNPRNILVDRVMQEDGSRRWTVTGIVDWETAGYYPEYWDYTKAMFEGFRWSHRYNNLVKDVFRELGDYEQEFDVERRSWESGDAV